MSLNKFNLGGLAAAALAGIIGAVGSTLNAGHTSGPAIAGAIAAGTATGIAAFFIQPKKDPATGTLITGPEILTQGMATGAAIVGTAVPAAQSAANTVASQVAGAAAAIPVSASASATGGVSTQDLITLAVQAAMTAVQAQQLKTQQVMTGAGTAGVPAQ